MTGNSFLLGIFIFSGFPYNVQPKQVDWTEMELAEPGKQTHFDIQRLGLLKLAQAKHFYNDNSNIKEIVLWWDHLINDAVGDNEVEGILSAEYLQEKNKTRPGGKHSLSPLVGAIHGAVEDSNSTTRCIGDIARLMFGLAEKEMLAFSYVDSAGKLGPSLLRGRFTFVGNYEQCRAIKVPADTEVDIPEFGANYAVLKVVVGKYNPTNQYANIMLQVGVCVPDTCSESEIDALLARAVQSLPPGIPVTLLPSQIRDSKREFTSATVIAIIVVSIIVALMILGTAYDLIFVQRPEWQLAAITRNDGLNVNTERDTNRSAYRATDADIISFHQHEGTPLLPKPEPMTQIHQPGVVSKILIAFSVYTNGSKVLNTSQPPGSLTAINGIRFLSMSWVILGHTHDTGMHYFDNALDTFTSLDHWTFDVIVNATFSVDTFFALSGLLAAYLTIKHMKVKGWKINWPLYYFHRFWRLTPPYMLTILLVLGLQRFCGYGELWDQVQPADKTFCEKNWWTNLLYVNNLVNPKEMCFTHSWYLANDMQYFVLSPLMLIALYIFMPAGVFVCLSLLVTTMVTTGILSTQHHWATSLFVRDLNVTEHFESYLTGYYIAPWCRIGPYIVGVMAGYLLAVNNGKVPMRRPLAFLGWILATATALAVIYGVHSEISTTHFSASGVTAWYNACARSAWAVCVCWVIVACASGYGGAVDSLLSWSPFVVLSKLTYMTYLIHPSIIEIHFSNMGQLYHYNTSNQIVLYLGLLMLSYMVAFVLMLGLESPMIGLEKTFLPQRKRDKP